MDVDGSGLLCSLYIGGSSMASQSPCSGITSSIASVCKMYRGLLEGRVRGAFRSGFGGEGSR